MIDFFFSDESRQNNPSRPGMGQLAAVGGLGISADNVKPVQATIDQICARYGFPPNEIFKWSPDKTFWMHRNLQGDQRTDFFKEVLGVLKINDVIAFIVVTDYTCQCATNTDDHDLDITTLFLERANGFCQRRGSQGFVVVDRPPGDRKDEDRFLAICAETLQSGTSFVKMDKIAHNIFATPSRMSRLLQASDLVTGCTLSRVAGEKIFSPPVFEKIKSILNREGNRIGGYGLKLHPDGRYGNLYHWLLKDTHFWKSNCGVPLPVNNFYYYRDPFTI